MYRCTYTYMYVYIKYYIPCVCIIYVHNIHSHTDVLGMHIKFMYMHRCVHYICIYYMCTHTHICHVCAHAYTHSGKMSKCYFSCMLVYQILIKFTQVCSQGKGKEVPWLSQ